MEEQNVAPHNCSLLSSALKFFICNVAYKKIVTSGISEIQHVFQWWELHLLGAGNSNLLCTKGTEDYKESQIIYYYISKCKWIT